MAPSRNVNNSLTHPDQRSSSGASLRVSGHTAGAVGAWNRGEPHLGWLPLCRPEAPAWKGPLPMLTLLGQKTKYCDGVTRRNFLQIGALSF